MKSKDLTQRIERAISKIKIDDGPDAIKILEGQSTGIYCQNFVDSSLENLVITLLGKCKKFDLRCREQKPFMAKARRRLVLGASEIVKQIGMNKIECVIIATDIDDDSLLGKTGRIPLHLTFRRRF